MKHSISQEPAQNKDLPQLLLNEPGYHTFLFHIPININILFPFPPIFRKINDRTTKQTRLAVFRAPGNPNIQFNMFEVNIYQHLLFYSIIAPIISTFPPSSAPKRPRAPSRAQSHMQSNSCRISLYL